MKEEIGKVFRDELADFRQEPSETLWADIQQDATLRKFNRQRKIRRILWRGVVPVLCVSIATGIAFFAFQNQQKNIEIAENKQIQQNEKVDFVQKSSIVQRKSETAHTFVLASEKCEETAQSSLLPETVLASSVAQNEARANDELVSQTVPAVGPQMSLPVLSARPSLQAPIAAQSIPNLFAHTVPQTGTQENLNAKSLKTSDLRFSHDTLVCRNSQLVLFVENALNVRWSTGNTGAFLEIYPDDPLHLYAQIETYDKEDTTIYITVDVYDCTAYVPSAFTPNGDGLNDEFFVHVPDGTTDFECVIFDRMSRTLFQTKSVYQGWDGTFNGRPVEQGAYFFVISYKDALNEKHVQKGQIVLIR